MPFQRLTKLALPNQVASRIQDAILNGSFDPGDTLPAERKLADLFGVNRSSIREALHRLEALGLVEIRQGGGTRVTDFLTTAGLQILPFLLAPGGQLDPKIMQDLWEIRVLLLGWTAEYAAKHAHANQLEELSKAYDLLLNSSSIEEAQARDMDFFEIMVAMTGNQVLALLSNAVRRVFLQNGEIFAHLYQEEPFRFRQHRATLEAILNKDHAQARIAMEAYGREGLNP